MVNSYFNYCNSTKPQSHVHCPPVVHLWCGFMAYHYTTVLPVQGVTTTVVTSNPETDVCTTTMSVAHSS